MDLGHEDFLHMQELRLRYSLHFLAFVITFFLNVALASAEESSSTAQKPQRVISLAPSITEIVYALGRGKQVVGVTSYCDFPAEARAVAKVGGFSDPNIEAVVSLRPTVVFGLPGHQALADGLDSFGIKAVLTKQESFADIFASIRTIGESLDSKDAAEKLTSQMSAGMAAVREQRRGEHRPTVLVTVGGHLKHASLDSIYAAGSSTLYHELIEFSGGRNVLESRIRYGKLSAEALLTLNPDVIIDLIPFADGAGEEQSAKIRKETIELWNTLPRLKAVQQKRLYLLDDEFVVNPGPRTVKTLKLFAEAINPSVYPAGLQTQVKENATR